MIQQNGSVVLAIMRTFYHSRGHLDFFQTLVLIQPGAT